MTDDKWPYWVVVVAFLILGFIAGITIPVECDHDQGEVYQNGLREGASRALEFDNLCLFGKPTPAQIDSATKAMFELLGRPTGHLDRIKARSFETTI